MDFLKQAQGALGGAAGGQAPPPADPNAAAAAGGQAPAAGQATGQQDALDKGVGAVMGKMGYQASASTTETVSDGVRSAFKSATGRDIPIQDKQ
ncbi:hypothetical protein CspeluHIS016_0800710 [Cutaneotrichosporon spelunceum]|uniref:Uncharacterized protein n=1 Tax=Cutaneotrichosporon spelunceum TaxID=1672016 RepID=A0AAD3YDQ6_9TREE|nr:hypothetical protein CspeluHIS016_0800710 [Cutaneotrichosporon spelunceum]